MTVGQHNKPNAAYSYCVACKLNHQDGKKHIYKGYHQTNLLELLQKEYEKIEGIKASMKTIVAVDPSQRRDNYFCFCCQTDVDVSTEKFNG